MSTSKSDFSSDGSTVSEWDLDSFRKVGTYTPNIEPANSCTFSETPTNELQNIPTSSSLINSQPLSSHVSTLPPNITVFDVAAYIVPKYKPISTIKLQKLVYYCQAWSMVWNSKPLFGEKIEAWANGPVVPELFFCYSGQFQIYSVPNGNPFLLSDTAKETIDAVLSVYGDKDAQWLVQLTHNEPPWIEARRGLKDLERGNREISLSSMSEYYSSIV